jgi:hypothetical protein
LRPLWWSRLAVGPLALCGFFLPWAHGPGVLAETEFSGFTLVGFAGRLQALDLTLAEGSMLWVVRLAILGVAIAGSWQLLLSPVHRRHPGYAVSGWYLVAIAVVCLGVGMARAGLGVPPSGLALIFLAAVVFIVGRLAPEA